MIRTLFLTFALSLLSLPALAQTPAAKWAIDPESVIGFSGTHAGREFNGTFKTWTAEIAFDARNLEGSSATVTVEMGSAQTGDKTYDGSLPSPEWLNPKAFPTATFVTKTFRQTGDATFEADGTLTIKGIARDVTLPFTLTQDGQTATVEGFLTLDRLAFDIGKESDSKGEWVSKDIGVTIALKATQAP